MFFPAVFKFYLSNGLGIFIYFMLSYSHGLSPLTGRVGRLRLRINIEFFIVIVIVAILTVLAIKSYLPLVTSAKVSNTMGRFFIDTRVGAVTYHALNGQWPKDSSELQSMPGHMGFEDGPYPYIQKADVVDGAIHLHFANDLAGEILTVRPAMPFGSSDSIIWVCGNHRSTDQWTVVGEDRTTFDNRYIVRSLW